MYMQCCNGVMAVFWLFIPLWISADKAAFSDCSASLGTIGFQKSGEYIHWDRLMRSSSKHCEHLHLMEVILENNVLFHLHEHVK